MMAIHGGGRFLRVYGLFFCGVLVFCGGGFAAETSPVFQELDRLREKVSADANSFRKGGLLTTYVNDIKAVSLLSLEGIEVGTPASEHLARLLWLEQHFSFLQERFPESDEIKGMANLAASVHLAAIAATQPSALAKDGVDAFSAGRYPEAGRAFEMVLRHSDHVFVPKAGIIAAAVLANENSPYVCDALLRTNLPGRPASEITAWCYCLKGFFLALDSQSAKATETFDMIAKDDALNILAVYRDLANTLRKSAHLSPMNGGAEEKTREFSVSPGVAKSRTKVRPVPILSAAVILSYTKELLSDESLSEDEIHKLSSVMLQDFERVSWGHPSYSCGIVQDELGRPSVDREVTVVRLSEPNEPGNVVQIQLTAMPAADGRFILGPLVPGKYLVEVQRNCGVQTHLILRRYFRMNAQDTPPPLCLQWEDGSISGKAVMDDGKPLAGATIIVEPVLVKNDGPNISGTTVTDEKGNFDVPCLLRGRYKVCSDAMPGLIPSAPATCDSTPRLTEPERGRQPLALTFKRGGMLIIRGQVQNMAGRPMEGVSLFLRIGILGEGPGNAIVAETATNARGAFEFQADSALGALGISDKAMLVCYLLRPDNPGLSCERAVDFKKEGARRVADLTFKVPEDADLGDIEVKLGPLASGLLATRQIQPSLSFFSNDDGLKIAGPFVPAKGSCLLKVLPSAPGHVFLVSTPDRAHNVLKGVVLAPSVQKGQKTTIEADGLEELLRPAGLASVEWTFHLMAGHSSEVMQKLIERHRYRIVFENDHKAFFAIAGIGKKCQLDLPPGTYKVGLSMAPFLSARKTIREIRLGENQRVSLGEIEVDPPVLEDSERTDPPRDQIRKGDQ